MRHAWVAVEIPATETVDGVRRFVGVHLHRAQPCTCSICERSGSSPGWAIYEDDVECVRWRGARKRSGATAAA